MGSANIPPASAEPAAWEPNLASLQPPAAPITGRFWQAPLRRLRLGTRDENSLGVGRAGLAGTPPTHPGNRLTSGLSFPQGREQVLEWEAS